MTTLEATIAEGQRKDQEMRMMLDRGMTVDKICEHFYPFYSPARPGPNGEVDCRITRDFKTTARATMKARILKLLP